MQEQINPILFENGDESSEHGQEVLDAVDDQALACQGVKQLLLDCAAQGRADGTVYWEPDEIVDRPVNIDGLAGNVRYIPTFAYRRLVYDQYSACKCSLCEPQAMSNATIDLPEGEAFLDTFKGAFNLYLNQFPYLDGQMLVASNQHAEQFSENQYRLLAQFITRTGFAGAGLQLEGSGATIPDHAHISIFDEPLALFNAPYQTIKQTAGITVATASEHPSACYKVSGTPIDARISETLALAQNIEDQNLSYNLYFDANGDAYIIPRTNRRSTSMDMKVGLSLPAGTYNGYVETAPTDLAMLQQEMWQHCQDISGEDLALALRETTLRNGSHQFVTGP